MRSPIQPNISGVTPTTTTQGNRCWSQGTLLYPVSPRAGYSFSITKSSADANSLNDGQANGMVCTDAAYSVPSGRTRNRPGSEKCSGSPELMPDEMNRPHSRAASSDRP